MNGQHLSGTPIVVDYWKLKDVPPRSLFFLTHMHADHTSGLSDRWSCPIHCTPVSAKLLIRKFKINPKLVVELEVGESKILRINCPGDAVNITVTTLDANHCPGSAMFMFEGYFGRILYTGDFRFSPSMLSNPLLNGSQSIDVLYLDNTYCDPQCKFPTREEAAEHVISLIQDYQDNPDKLVVIGVHTLGKEDLLVKIATRLSTWIGVSPEKYETLKLLEMPNVFTQDMEGTRIRVFPNHMVSKNLLAEMRSGALAILPTCLHTGQGSLLPPPKEVAKVVPYSDHSSFDELRRFVKSVRPRCIRPIVKSFSGENRSSISLLRGNMSVFDDLLDPTPIAAAQTPNGIQKLLSSWSPLTSSTATPVLRVSVPRLQRSHSGSRHRNTPKGVQYLSPSKNKNPFDSEPATSGGEEEQPEPSSKVRGLNQNVGNDGTDHQSVHIGPFIIGVPDRNDDVGHLNWTDGVSGPLNLEDDLQDVQDHNHLNDYVRFSDQNQSTGVPHNQCHAPEEVLKSPDMAASSSAANPKHSTAPSMPSLQLEGACALIPTEGDTHSKSSTSNDHQSDVYFTCARVRPIECWICRKRETVDDDRLSTCSAEPMHESPDIKPPLQLLQAKSESEKNPPVQDSEACDVPPHDSVDPTPLPKLAPPNFLERLYGVEPSTREKLTKRELRTNKRHISPTGISPSERLPSTKKSRTLPEMLTQSTKHPVSHRNHTNILSATHRTTEETGREEVGLLAQLGGVGLLPKLKSVNLSSPTILQAIHSALDSAQTVCSSESNHLPASTVPFVCDASDNTCEESMSGLAAAQEERYGSFMQWLLTYSINSEQDS